MDRVDPAHPSSERMQELLDEALDESQARDVRLHMASCARCRSQFEAWSLLFRELGDLADHAPAPSFSERVIEALPEGTVRGHSWTDRVRRWLGVSRAKPNLGSHLASDVIQSFLDGELAPARTTMAEAHLTACRACRDEVEAWRRVTRGLDILTRLEPSPAFGERVMAHVRVRSAAAMARPGLRERLHSWVVVHPRRLQRFAALAGAGVTPAVTMVLMTYSVLSHPLVTPESLASFLWLKTRSGLAGVGSAAAEQMGASNVGAYVVALLEASTSSTQAAAIACLLFTGLVLSAAWVLFRNLFAGRLAWSRDARLPF